MLPAAVIAAIVLAAGGMDLRSDGFQEGATLPQAYMAADCGGQNRSPLLRWTNAPAATKSFALVLHDPDAPISGGFYHWVIYNVPSSTHELAAGAALHPDQLGDTSLGKPGYYGPCPPPGPAHHYRFTIYALSVARIDAPTPLSGAQLQQRIAGNVLARATIEGVAAHP